MNKKAIIILSSLIVTLILAFSAITLAWFVQVVRVLIAA